MQPGNRGSKVVPLFEAKANRESLVRGLIARQPGAAAALYDLCGERVNRLVWRLLGADPEHDDVVHQVFINVICSIHTLRDPSRLEPWVASVAVNTVRREIRRRKLRSLFEFVGEPPSYAGSSDPDAEATVRRFFSVLSQIRADDRIVFTLRYVEGETLPEIAALRGVSLATAKRYLKRAMKVFVKRAKRDVLLAPWLTGLAHETRSSEA
jgi:RNA polymerase sigma-70 factor (ECF subfamily)